jgi:hypothetical protein
VKRLVLAVVVVTTVACGHNSSRQPTEPDSSVAPTPANAEQCEAAGYTVVGDIGDGRVRCPDGMDEVSRIQYGIEGGVCCKSATDATP